MRLLLAGNIIIIINGVEKKSGRKTREPSNE